MISCPVCFTPVEFVGPNVSNGRYCLCHRLTVYQEDYRKDSKRDKFEWSFRVSPDQNQNEGLHLRRNHLMEMFKFGSRSVPSLERVETIDRIVRLARVSYVLER
jgi:hypothetical protein